MTDYTIVSAFRNKDQVLHLFNQLRNKGFSCYNFTDKPADPNNPEAHPEEQMKVFEAVENFLDDKYYKEIFAQDLEGLKNAKNVILLLPSGISAHIEIGIAYGLGKKCILIGKPSKPETLYLLFDEYFDTINDFLKTL